MKKIKLLAKCFEWELNCILTYPHAQIQMIKVTELANHGCLRSPVKGVVINVLCLYETDFYTVRGYRGKFFALHLDLLFFAFFRENLLKMKPGLFWFFCLYQFHFC